MVKISCNGTDLILGNFDEKIFFPKMWSSTSPHDHDFGSVGDHNYCRNPDGEQGPW